MLVYPQADYNPAKRRVKSLGLLRNQSLFKENESAREKFSSPSFT